MRNQLHHCDRCRERSEVWKRDSDGKFFTYCITPGCQKNFLDRNISGGTIGNTTPENKTGQKDPGSERSEGTQMTYRDAKILITEARKLGYRGTDWEQSFLQRLEAMQPVILLPEDASVVEEFYRRATGGGYRTNKRSLSRTPADMGEF